VIRGIPTATIAAGTHKRSARLPHQPRETEVPMRLIGLVILAASRVLAQASREAP